MNFVETKKKSHEIFFSLFNELVNNRKQIVITSDKPPRELRGMESRLVSRFTSGLTVSIDTPEFETAKAILRKKIEYENLEYPITEEVIDFIATHFNNDVRELEGSVKRLLFYILIYPQDIEVIDLKLALEAFNGTVSENIEKSELTISHIKKTVADFYNLTITQLNSKSRTSNIIVARHIAMYLCREVANLSFPKIGDDFGKRDHSTVMHAYKKIEQDKK